jgi:hypothetical protein
VPVSYFFEGLAASDAEPGHVIPMTRDEHDLLLAFRSAREDARGPLVAFVQASREQPDRAAGPQRSARLRRSQRPLRPRQNVRQRGSEGPGI